MITVKNEREAWELVKALTGCQDFRVDKDSTERAGYKIYRGYSESGEPLPLHVSGLCARLEINTDTEARCIWIDDYTERLKAVIERAEQAEAKLEDTRKALETLARTI